MQLYSMPTLTCSEDLNGGTRNYGMKLESTENSMVANLSLRDRIIHILALKPLKKIELLAQLEKEGVTNRDRTTYVSVCCEVAQRNSTTNEYILSREFYNKLKLDWPLYTEENRAVIKSLLEKLETSPVGSASNTPDLSPCPSTNSESPIGSRQPKMPGPSIDEVNYALPASKKRRISHAQPPSAQQPSTQQPLQPSQTAQQPPPRPLQQQVKELPKKEVHTMSAPNKNYSVFVQPKVPDAIKSMQPSQQQPAQQPAPQPLLQHPSPKKKVRTKSAPNKNSSASVQPKVPNDIKSMQLSRQQPAQQPARQPLSQHPKELQKEKVRTESAPNKNSSVSVQPKVPGSIKSMQQSQQQPAQQPPPQPLPQHPKELPKERVRTKSVPNKNSSVSVQPKVPDAMKSMQQSQQQPAQQPPPQPLPQHPKEFLKERVRTKSVPNKNSSVFVQPKVPDAMKSMQQSQQQPAQQPAPQPLPQHPKELPREKVRTESVPNKNSSVSVQPTVTGMIKYKSNQDNRGLSNGAAPSAMDESGQKNVNNFSVPLSSEDYLKKYGKILTDKQRNSYNKDFDAEYDEYKMLSEKTSNRTKIFRDLNAKMKSTDDIDVYEHFRNKIISEYDKLKCDTEYVEQKVRCAHLHVKLAHIRQLVTDYDQRSQSASSS